MKSKLSAFILSAVVLLFASCVSTSKYKESEEQVQKLGTELASCNSNATSAAATANSKIAALNGQVTTLSNQNAALVPEAMAYKELKSDAKAQRAMLDATLAAQGTSLDEIRDKLITGLSALIDSGIDVTISNGLLYLTLPEKLLFSEGSAALGKKSKEALSPVASILNNYPKVQIYVVGHTDTLKIHTAKFEDNWSLSTERANSIVRVFRDSYAVNPTRLLSAGRSKYSPVADNSTKAGRALNRRIQIILNPQLIALWEMAHQ